MASLIRNADIAPDAAIANTKLAAWAANRSAGGFKLTNLADGTAPGDAVNKAQLDAQSGGGTWGSITGTLSDQTDLQSALNAKVSAVSIASANGVSGSSSGGQTPILTIALGAITPSSVVSTGIVTGTNLSGTNTGDQTITLTGNVTGSGAGSFAATIANSAVTLAKMADVATASVFYRKTAGTGAPEVNTLATLKTDLGLTGTNSGDQTITLSGDVSGTGTGAITTVIGAGKVTLSMLADLPGLTVIGRTASTPGPPQAIAGANGTILRVVGTTLGFGSISASSVNMATDRLLGRSTAGAGAVEEIMIGSGLTLAAGTLTSSGSGGTVTAVSIATANGVSGSSSGGATPALTIALGAITPSSVASTGTVTGTNLSGTNTGDQTITLTGDVTGTGTGSFAATIANDAVTLAKMANMATASFLGRNTAGTGDPEVLSIATASLMLNLSGLYQPLDQDLTSLSAASGGHDIYYRTAQGGGTWIPVIIGANLSFVGNTLSQLFQEAGRFTPTDEIVSAGTLVLTGLDAPYIDVTGATNITAITLADGQQMELRFTGAGLTITPDASLLTPGGVPLVVATGGLVVASAAGGVVTITDHQTATGYSTQTFNNIYMNPGANIGFADEASPFFHIGGSSIGSSGVGMTFTDGGLLRLFKQDAPSGAGLLFSITAIASSSKTFAFPNYSGQAAVIERAGSFGSGFDARFDAINLTANRIYDMPDQAGTLSLVAGVESLTNKKLGSLTTNGFVKTSGGDGTLSVDTATYLTSAAIGVSIQAFDADLSTWAGITPGSNVGAFLATPSSANLAAAVTGETGTGALVFGTLPTIDSPVINGLPSGTAVSEGPDAQTLVLRDSSGSILVNNISASLLFINNVFPFLLVTAASGSSVTLTATSEGEHVVTGTNTNQTFNLPVASSLTEGHTFFFKNEQTGTGTIIVKYSGGVTGITIAPGAAAKVSCKNPSGGTASGSWTITYFGTSITTAKKLTVTHSLTLAGTDGTTMTFPATSSSIARTNDTNTFTGVQTMTSPALTTPAITGLATGSGVASAATASTLVARDASGDITGNRLIAGAQIRLKGYTVATLPAGTQGDTAFVTDALAPAFLAVLVGGGAVVTPCFYNGADWIGS